MTYKINDKVVRLDQFSTELGFKVFKSLESYEAMGTSDIAECIHDIKEIYDYVTELYIKAQNAVETVEEYTDNTPYERLTGHEMGVCGGRV